MGFFTIGNLLTLGIVLLILILYRQMDRNNRNIKLLRDYSEKLKKELNVYMEEKENAVKDYGISLNVERDSARELLKHLQLTEEELAEKAQAVARIDSQIKTYEDSLAELDRMTSRVQENMNRVRDESAFVDATGKRIAETKSKLEELNKELKDIEKQFERENSESLEKTVEMVLAVVKSQVSDLGAAAQGIERQVEDHREEINKIEEERAANLARDIEHINTILSTAVEQAAGKADKMEEAALVKLREQADERLHRIRVAEEDRLKSYHENAKTRVAEIQNLVKGIREEWRAERNDWETRDRAYQDERKQDIQELSSKFADAGNRLTADLASMEKRMGELAVRTDSTVSSQETMLRSLFTESETRFTAELSAIEKRTEALSVKTNEIVSSQETMLVRSAEEMKQRALEITEAKLEEYRHAQDAEFRRLETLADDSRKLDTELRRNMQEVTDRVQEDFSRFEKESTDTRNAEADNFSSAAAALKEEMAGVERELAALKAAAYENVSEKLKLFEDDFFVDLSNRSGEIDKRLLEWRENLETRLSLMGEEAETKRQELERGLTEEIRKNLSTQDERLVSELEHLRAETSAFEDGIRGQMNTADESVVSFKEQLDHSLEEARKEAEISIRSEINKHSIVAAEAIKQYQRELDGKLREMSDYIQARNGEISGVLDASRAELDEARSGLAGKIRELDDTIEDARRRVRDLAAETDNRIASVRSSVEDAERHIREAVDQTKLIDRADELRLEMERRIEDLKGDIDRLDQRRAEAFQLENDFVKIKRLEDDVNAKMTRFLSEKRRIETMEADFNRLLQISRAVEEKLTQVTASDDTLQGVQLQIRKLEEALVDTEEKFQRMERKSQILDNTNDGIDRNFKVLQESEKLSTKIGGDIERFTGDIDLIKVSIEKLAGESDRAREAVDKIEVLDNILEEVEERINSMQRARQWIADAETRMEKLNREAQIQSRAIDSLMKGKKSGSAVDLGEGAPPPQKKENIIALARQGWTVDEIAKALKISRGEVELTLEVAPRD